MTSPGPNTPLLSPTVQPIPNHGTANDKPIIFKRVPELYFPDGNIVLEAGTTHFRISSGILAARSPVFKEVLSLPQPKEEGGERKVDGCDVVHLFGDDPQEVTYFLRAIYDSRYVLVHDQSTTEIGSSWPIYPRKVSLNHPQRKRPSLSSPESCDSARNTMWTTCGGGR
jgi:BTB/POZ domain